MNITQASRIWDRALVAYHRDGWAAAARLALGLDALLLESYYRLHAARDEQTPETLLGIPIRIDPTLAADELRLEARDGSTIRLVNIGEAHVNP